MAIDFEAAKKRARALDAQNKGQREREQARFRANEQAAMERHGYSPGAMEQLVNDLAAQRKAGGAVDFAKAGQRRESGSALASLAEEIAGGLDTAARVGAARPDSRMPRALQERGRYIGQQYQSGRLPGTGQGAEPLGAGSFGGARGFRNVENAARIASEARQRRQAQRDASRQAGQWEQVRQALETQEQARKREQEALLPAATAKNLTLDSFMRGYENARLGEETYKAMSGAVNEREAYLQRLADERYQFAPKGLVQRGVSGAAELLGQQYRQWTNPRSLAMGGTAAATMAFAGQAGPQALVPEEVLTVPAAFTSAMAAGSAMSNFEIEAGSAYNEMLDNGISPEVARAIALGVGGVNAALESLQADELVKGLKAVGGNPATQNTARQILEELGRRGLEIGNETLQEVAQEASTIIGAQAASKYETGKWAYGAQEVAERLKDTAVGSALSFGMMNVPGAVRNGVYTARANTGDALRLTDNVLQDSDNVSRDAGHASQGADRASRDARNAPQGVKDISQDVQDVLQGTSQGALGEHGTRNYRYLKERDGGKTADFDAQYRHYYQFAKSGLALERIPQAASVTPMKAADAQAAAYAGRNDGAAEAAATVQRMLNGETVSNTEIDRALSFPETRGTIEQALTGPLPQRFSEAREAVRAAMKGEAAEPQGRDFDFEGLDLDAEAQASDNVSQGNPQPDADLAERDAGGTVRASDFAERETGSASGLVRNELYSRLDAQTADAIDRVAKRAGVTVVLSEDARANGEYRDGKITLRADAENPVRQVFVHELTHHLETGGEYQAFADFVTRHLQESGQDVELQLAAIAQDYKRHGVYLDEDGARRELVAKFAEGNLFTDERSIQRLAQENRSLGQRIRDWIHNLLARFGRDPAQRAEVKFLQQAERMYEKALRAAEGRQDGSVQYLILSTEDSMVDAGRETVIHNAVLEKVVANAAAIEQNGIVCELTGQEFSGIRGRREIVDAATDYFNSVGGAVERPGFGRVLLSKRGVKDSLAHGYGEMKKISFAAVPDVIRSGVQIDFQPKWKGRPVDSYVFAGQITIDDAPQNIGVVVLRSPQSDRYYLHEIIAIEKDAPASFQTGASQNGGLPGDADSSFSETSIAQPGTDGKGQKSYGGSLSELNKRLAQLTPEEAKALKAENERQKKRIAYLEGQLKRTPPEHRNEQQVRKIARDVLSEYESKADREHVTRLLQKLYDDMSAGDERSLSANLYATASEAAVEIVRESRHLNDELARQYKGMRDQLRTTRLTISPQDRLSVGEGYSEFRRRNMGRLLLVNEGGVPVDTMYEQLRRDYGEAFFPEDITHPADRLERIGDVLDSLKPVYENPYADAIGDAANALALDLIGRGVNVDAAKPTVADRFAETLQRERNGNRMLMQDYEKEIELHQETIRDRQRVQNELALEAQRRVKEVEDLKAHYAERDAKRRERKFDRIQRERLLKVAKRVNRMQATPQNRAVIEELIGSLDLVGISMRADTRLKLTELRSLIQEQAEKDPDWEANKRLLAQVDRLDDTQIASMKIEDVHRLTNVLLALEHETRNENRLIQAEDRRDVYAQAQDTVKSIERAKAPKDVGSRKNGYLSMMLSPERFVRRLVGYDESSPLYKAVKALSDGQRKAQDFEMRTDRFFDRWHSDKNFMQKMTGEKSKRIAVQGMVMEDGQLKPVRAEITPAQQVSLYLHSRHYANRTHILKGGIAIPDAKLYAEGKMSEAYNKGVRLRLDEDALRKLTRDMDSDVRAYADAVSRWFNGMSKEAINETSTALDGYERAAVKGYFPIRTDPNFTRSEAESLIFDATVEGWGNLKKRQNNSGSPLLLEDVTDVLNRHAQKTAQYYGLAIPVRNLNKLMNVTGIESNWSVKEAISRKWGKGALDYLDDMKADAQGARARGSDGLGRLMGRMRSAQAGAVLTLNPSVIMKQAASYPTAAGVLGWKPLLRALGPQAFSVDRNTIAKYTPDYWYRRKGYSTTELGDIAGRKKGLPKWANLIQGVDLATTRTLWLASEYYVQEQNKGKPGAPEIRSEAYYSQVAEVYNRVIEETQPNYAVMQRPGILRSPNELTKSFVMFKTQSFQNFNMLYDAFGNWRAKAREYALDRSAENRQALKEARAGMRRNVSAQIVSAAVLSGMTFASAMLLGRPRNYTDDDDGEMTRESVLAQLAKDFTASLSGMLLGGSEVWSAIDATALGGTWFDIEAGGVSSVNDLYSRFGGVTKAAADLWDAFGDEEQEVTQAQAQHLALQGWKLAKVTAETFGVPAGNVEKLFHALGGLLVRGAAGKYIGQYYVLLTTVSAESGSGDYLDLLYKAYREESPEYERLREMMINLGISEDRIESGFKARQKKTGEYQAAFKETGSALRRAVEGSPLYQQNAGKAEDWIEAYAREAGKEASEREYAIDGKWNRIMRDAESTGLEEGDVLLYRLALEMANDDGNHSISQAEAKEALDGMDGLTRAQKAYLFGSTNTTWKNNPYR